MHQIRFRLGLRPRPPQTPLGELTALPQSAPPDSLAGFKGPTCKGREGKEGAGKGEGKGREKGGKEWKAEGEGGGGREGGRLRHGFWGMDAPAISRR